jgi:hypothetical protein
LICFVLGGLACGGWPFCDIWTPSGFGVFVVFVCYCCGISDLFFFGGHFVARPPFCFVCVFSVVYGVLVYRFFGTTGVDCVFTVVFCVRRPFCGDVSAILIFFFLRFSCLGVLLFLLFIYLTYVVVF